MAITQLIQVHRNGHADRVHVRRDDLQDSGFRAIDLKEIFGADGTGNRDLNIWKEMA